MGAHGAGAATLEDLTDRFDRDSALKELSDAYRALEAALARRNLPLNPQDARVPSGAVYLAQFLAHDLIMSVAERPEDIPKHNLVSRPLMLETLYGTGPLSAPHLYAPTMPSGCMPATDPASRRAFRPVFRDRCGIETLATDLHRTPSCCGTSHKFEAIVADRRNDSHAILAWITAQWMRFHNAVFEISAAWVPSNAPEFYRERFRMTQTVVRARWHSVIRTDVLDYLLHPDFHDLSFPAPAGMPDPRARIAMRALHCLPLGHYWLTGPHSLGTILDTGSHGSEDNLKNPSWLVDHKNFFDGDARNRTRYRPAFRKALRIPPDDPDVQISDGRHVLSADLNFDLLARAGSTISEEEEALLPEELRGEGRTAVLTEFLTDLAEKDEQDGPGPLVGDYIALLAESPPLVLVLLLEADRHPSDGKSLGRFGSSLLAPWVLGALQAAEDVLRPTLTKDIPRADRDRLICGGFEALVKMFNEKGKQ